MFLQVKAVGSINRYHYLLG